MLTLAAVDFLQSATGMEALRKAAALDLEGGRFLRELTRLRRQLSPELAAAVLEQTQLRRRATAKFRRAAEMLFTPEALEQASSEVVAGHSAARYSGCARIADVCCGVGGDTIALAAHGFVDAFDRDPVRLACARHNLAVYGLDGRVAFHCVDVLETDPIGGVAARPDAIFFDPGRRLGGRRIFSLAEYQPPVALIERWRARVPAIGVKVAPGVAHAEVVWDCEEEFVAEGHELKEALLWFGPLDSASRRATVLPEGVTLVASAVLRAPLSEPLAWLYDPSPAVTRAGLVQELAALLDAAQLDPEIAYLTATAQRPTAFARVFAVEEWLPFSLKRLQSRLRSGGVGRVTLQKRGSPLDTDALERRLRGPGRETRTVIFTRLRGAPIVAICRPAG